jgi:catechol 2,3-dioxygenase-like lactoylglutathione lyase family enzyme
VADIDEALHFYRDYTGLDVTRNEIWPEEIIRGLFRLQTGFPARVAVLEGGLNRNTQLRLIEFKHSSGKPIRGAAQTWDAGFYCLAYLVKDLERVYKELGAKGYSFVAPPYHYELSWAPFEVSEGTVRGPEGVSLNHFQRFKPAESFNVPRNYVRLDHCAMVVQSLEEVRRFCEAVGLDCLAGEKAVPGGLVNEILGLAPDYRVRIADWGIRGGTSSGIEFIEVTPKGRVIIGRPPDTGLFMAAFKVESLADALARIQAAGFPLHTGPLLVPQVGGVPCAIVEGPAGILMMLKG